MFRAFAVSVLISLPLLANAGHSDMFSCRSKKGCPVAELGDGNFELSLSIPHFVMFYAPWCGHCKQLAPKLKKAAKELEGSGVKMGAVDVEPNPKVQGKFPDIRGFPTLKFLPSSNPRKAIDYNGQREVEDIVQFAKEQAKKAGVALAEPVPLKAHTELYTYFGRAALSNLPAMLLVGKSSSGAGEASPSWLGKLAAELRKPDPSAKGGKRADDPEAETKRLLKDAAKGTKLAVVKEGIANLLEAIESEAAKGPPLSAPVVSVAFSSDAATAASFGLQPAQLPALVLASVDRKTAGGAYVVETASGGLLPAGSDFSPSKKTGPGSLKELAGHVRELLPSLQGGPGALRTGGNGGRDVNELPAFPKPANVLAAEERERKRKAREGSIAAVASQETLESACYAPPPGKTCALLALRGGADAASESSVLAAIAKKFAKDGFTFAAVDVSSTVGADSVLDGLFADGGGSQAFQESDGAVVGLAVVKGGKRPRSASIVSSGILEDATAFEKHLENVVGGSASFAKLKGGLPAWTSVEDADSDAAFADDEL